MVSFDAVTDDYDAGRPDHAPAVPGVHQGQGDVERDDDLELARWFEVGAAMRLAWTREVSTDGWLIDVRSHSFVANPPAAEREQLVGRVAAVVRDAFPSGAMTIRYDTRMWIGHLR